MHYFKRKKSKASWPRRGFHTSALHFLNFGFLRLVARCISGIAGIYAARLVPDKETKKLEKTGRKNTSEQQQPTYNRAPKKGVTRHQIGSGLKPGFSYEEVQWRPDYSYVCVWGKGNISNFSFPGSPSLVWWTRETLGSGQVLGQTLHICCCSVGTTQN